MDERAFNGKILEIDLTTRHVHPQVLPEQLYREYLGGYGIGVRLLWDRIPAGADPLGPDNVLGLMPGLMTGTPIFGNRFQAVCKSPVSGGWGDANCGGDFGPYLKFAGWDGVLFSGKADRPLYVLIDDTAVSFHDAAEFWGQDAITVEDALKERYGKKSSIAVIGQAGERLSCLAGICNDRGRLAARSGVGAVMGSKNLKAVVVKSTRQMILQHDKDARALMRTSLSEFEPVHTQYFRTYGTSGGAANHAFDGDSPVLNWGAVGTDVFSDPSVIAGDRVNEKMEKHYACWHCPLACGAESVESTDARFPYPRHTHRPEYETMAAFGNINGNHHLDSLIHANHLCNAYGFDTIGAGATVSFAIECFENGILTREDTDGLELRWGNPESVIALLEMMGKREGIGDLLADGVRVAAEKIGRGAERFAVHVGGQEPAMHDPKLIPDLYTAYKIDPTPGRHTQYMGSSDFGVPFPPAPEDRTDYTGRGEHHRVANNSIHITNSAGMCLFIMMPAPTTRYAAWINQVTGWDMTPEELDTVGDRIANLRMAFTVREGVNPARRHVPDRLWGGGDAMFTHGPTANVRLDGERLVQDYLATRDWDPDTTKPSRAKLETLGLKDVADVLHA